MRRNLILLMPILSVLNGVDIAIGGLTVRFDHLFGVFLFFIVLYQAILLNKIYSSKQDIFLILLWLLSIIVSFSSAPDVKYSLVQSINLITVGFSYFVITNLITTRQALKKFVVISLNTATIISILATVLFIISMLIKKPLFGINIEQTETVPFGIYFTTKEPNIYGSYMLANFITVFVLYFEKANISLGISNRRAKYILFSTGIGVLLSFTRSVWISLFICILIFNFKSISKLYKNLPKLGFIILGLIVFYYVATNVLGITFLKYKIDNLFSADSGTGEGRVLIWITALDNWVQQKNYLTGNGTYSFASFFNNGSYDTTTNAWIGNFLITLLHDYGIIGVILFLTYFILLIKRPSNKSNINVRYDYAHEKLFYGLKLAAIGVLICFLFTMAFSFTYVWILFGLVVVSKRYILNTIAEQNV